MSLICARLHFAVRELWTRRELLGSAHEFRRGDALIRPTFPRHKDDFELGIVRDEWRDRAIDTTGMFGKDPIEKVLIIQVDVERQADFSIEDFPGPGRAATPGRPLETVSANASVFLDSSLALAKATLHDFLSWTKLTREQKWLGLSGELPEDLGGGRLFDLEAGGERIPFGVERLTIQARPEESALSTDNIAPLIELLDRGERPGLPEELLADAEHFAWRGDTTDLRRAVLLAAIAAEVKAKETLEEKAPNEAAQLLDVVLAGPRLGVNVRPAALFNSLARGAVGRSLRERTPGSSSG